MISNVAHGLHGAEVEVRWLSVHHLDDHDTKGPHVNLSKEREDKVKI